MAGAVRNRRGALHLGVGARLPPPVPAPGRGGGVAGRPARPGAHATASPPVREEILTRLRVPDATVVVRGFDRPNIDLGVRLFEDARTASGSLA